MLCHCFLIFQKSFINSIPISSISCSFSFTYARNFWRLPFHLLTIYVRSLYTYMNICCICTLYLNDGEEVLYSFRFQALQSEVGNFEFSWQSKLELRIWKFRNLEFVSSSFPLLYVHTYTIRIIPWDSLRDILSHEWEQAENKFAQSELFKKEEWKIEQNYTNY